MPKRKRGQGYTSKDRKFIKRARAPPRRAYKGSMVPLRSGGYSFDAPELKYFDKAVASYLADDNTPSISNICTPVQGTAFFNRIGTRIKVKSIYIRGYVSHTTAQVTPLANFASPVFMVRVSLVLDFQPNGLNPGITDIFTNVGPTNMINLYNRDRFRILKEKTFVFDPYIVSNTVDQSIASTVNQIKPFKMYKKCNLPVFFNTGNAGTAADIASNNLLLVVQSDYPNTLAGGADLHVITRVRFQDP
jgi:hypothetical protein